MWRTPYLPSSTEIINNLIEHYKQMEIGSITNYKVHNVVATGRFYRHGVLIHQDDSIEKNLI